MLYFDWLGLTGISWAPIGLCWFCLWRQKLLPQDRLCGVSNWGKGVSMKKNTFCTWATCCCWIPPPRASWPVCVGEGFSGPWMQRSFQAGSLVLEGSRLQKTPWLSSISQWGRESQGPQNKGVYFQDL